MAKVRVSIASVTIAVAAALAGCAQGPADFITERLPSLPATTEAQPVLDPSGRDELARDLGAAAARQADEGRAATGGMSSAMALAIIRQQQEEEARALLGAATETCDPAADPACGAAAE